MPVNYAYDNLAHSVVAIFGRRADRATRSKISVQAIDITNVQVAKPIVRTNRARVHVGRALAQYYPNSTPAMKVP